MFGIASHSAVDMADFSSHESVLGGVVVTASVGRRRSVVRVHGELDTVGSARLGAVCRDLEAQPGSALLLDLDGVTFAGSAAVALLRRLRVDLEAAGFQLLVRPSEPIRRLFEIVD